MRRRFSRRRASRPKLVEASPGSTNFEDIPDLTPITVRKKREAGAVPISVLASVRAKPDHRVWPGKYLPIEPGECRWCGADIVRADGTPNRRKTFCNPGCRKQFDIRTQPSLWRRIVYHQDMGICQDCGEVFDFFEDDGWQADHKKPLFVAHREGDWTAWDPANGQVLCEGCHKDKTQADFRTYGYPTKWPENFKQAA